MNTHFLNFTLRSLTPDDAPQLFDLIDRNRLRLRDYFPVTSATIASLAASFKFVDEKLQETGQREHYTFVIEDENKQLQGLFFIKNVDWCVPKGELAYFVDSSLEGKGIMTKALAEVVSYGWNTLEMNKLFLLTGVDNHASRRIAGKNGFELEGILRNNFRIATGELVDMAYYGLLKD